MQHKCKKTQTAETAHNKTNIKYYVYLLRHKCKYYKLYFCKYNI